MSIRSRWIHVLLCSFLVPSARKSQAQQAPVAIDQILSQLEVNTERYSTSIPSFLCDEHITSQEIHAGEMKHQTSVEAVFRVSRSTREAGVLDESREVRIVDGRPSDGKKLNMPLTFSGGFSGVLTKFLSAAHEKCFSYHQENSPAGSIAFSFVANEAKLGDPSCRSIPRGTKGRAIVDSTAMQVTHIERTVPFPIGKDQAVLSTAAVDFAPVTLNDTMFWLPVTVTAFTTQTQKTNELRFMAHYGNYHRFDATSSIVPGQP